MGMRMTDHFRDEVVGPRRRPTREGITYERCVQIVQHPRHSERQGDERVFWGHAPELPGATKWLKVVTDLEAQVLVTAYKDKGFAARERRGEV